MRDWAAVDWLLRGLTGLGPAAAAWCAVGAGAGAGWAVVVIGVVGAVGALLPDSPAPTAALAAAVLLWALGGATADSMLLLPAAAAVVITHVAACLASYGPPGVALPGTLLTRWAGRAALLWLPAPVAWGTVRLARDGGEVAGMWPLAAVLLVGAAVGTAVALRRLAGAQLPSSG